MREIKFRAWDKKKKIMLPGSSIWKCDFREYNTGDYAIMQYIGFKNICQGDKCRLTFNEFYSNHHFSIDEGGILVGVVKMVDCMWVVMTDDKSEIPFYDIINGEIDVEVIGNIYEGES